MLIFYQIWFWLGSWLWPGWAARQAFNIFITPQSRNQKPLPPVFERAERLLWLESGDTCEGWRWNAGAKRRILILHGFSSSSRNFAHLIEALICNGGEVIAFDAPAHGNSEGKQIHSLRYRKFIQEIRQEWGPFDGYIAHSFGGLSLSLALEEQPPRMHERVVLIAPATETRSALKQLQSTLQLSERIMIRIAEAIKKRSGKPTDWFSVNRVVKNLSNPILWIHDQNDDVTPYADLMPTLQRAPAHVRFRFTEGLGHRRIYRDAEVCREIVDFLTSKDPTL